MAGIVGALAIGVGAYFGNQWWVCRSLESDYLRTIDGYTSNVYSGALAGAVGVEFDREKQKEMQDMSLRLQQMQLTAIYERCGDEKARSVQQGGLVIIDDIRRKPG
ncbi:hypothetical protein [Erythrobacter tepidarius]|uniref:hypothetical protein n=1 Tax=Erythrobacter tepidarius TaxID=60454 RepID=UPI000A366273|nr:hypothetical protein [Erythrobacter tepidarius]